MNSKIETIEVKALKIGVATNLIMAISGWVTYALTNSEALLLDGNFSFINAISIFAAIIIVKKRHQKTPLFPYGRYFFESFFILFKGLLILGLTIAAIFQNVIKIIEFIGGQEVPKLIAGPILYYSIFMTILCFGMAFYFNRSNKIIENKSSLINVEAKSSIIDGYLSLIVGIALLLTTIVPIESIFSFLLYIGDSIIVILLSLFMLKIPYNIIKEGFIELGGGYIQNIDSKKHIEEKIHAFLPSNFKIESKYITKLGSSYLIIVYVQPTTESILVATIENYRKQLLTSLNSKFQNLEVEIIIGD